MRDVPFDERLEADQPGSQQIHTQAQARIRGPRRLWRVCLLKLAGLEEGCGCLALYANLDHLGFSEAVSEFPLLAALFAVH